MKNIYALILSLATFTGTKAQTILWSSDSEDFATFSIADQDGDGNNWGLYTLSENGAYTDMGFNPGTTFVSSSYDIPNGVALTPDNLLFTPAALVTVPNDIATLDFKMKVGASDPDWFAENFAVYVFDEAVGASFDTKIHEETLTEGNTTKDITASIPTTFAGKTIGFIIRHYNSTDQNEILVDDFEVSYTQTLAVADKESPLNTLTFSPNPVKDVLTLNTDQAINTISVFNQLGQNVMTIKESGINNNTVNLSDLANGVYMITVQSGNLTKSLKIAKQ